MRAAALPHRDALACFLILLAVYLLTLSGHLYSPDEEAMYYVTRGVASGAGVAVPTDDVVPMPLRAGRGDLSYAPYGVLPSLLALPLYALGALAALGAPAPIHEYTTRLAVSALNAPITALTAALLLRFALRLGYGRRAAWLGALGYGLCTFAWPYARTFFSEPLTALLLLAAVERAHAFRTTGDRRALLLSGLAAGLLLPTRIVEILALPLLALYVLRVRGQETGDRRQETGDRSQRSPVHPRTRASAHPFLALGSWLLALAPGVVLLLGYNVARFGTPLATGYGGEGNAFTTPLAEGLYGLLFSPGKSLLLYAPPVLLGLIGLPLLARRERWLALLLGALVAAHVLVYAAWHAWDGGGVWGPRLLLPVVPLLLLAAAATDQRPTTNDQRPTTNDRPITNHQSPITNHQLPITNHQSPITNLMLRRLVVTLLLALGLVNALAGVLVNFGVYVNSGVPARYRLYNAAQSPLLAHWRILAGRVAARAGAEQCAFADGFYATEARGEALPRYAGAQAVILCQAAGVSIARLEINDYRPPDASPSALALSIGGQRAALRRGQGSRVLVLLPAGGAQLTLTNTTWNPAASGVGTRDGFVGTLLAALDVTSAGQHMRLADAAIEPPPASPRLMWGWYFVPYNHHLLDLWWWYAPRAGLSPPGLAVLAAVIIGAALAALAGAARALRRQGE